MGPEKGRADPASTTCPMAMAAEHRRLTSDCMATRRMGRVDRRGSRMKVRNSGCIRRKICQARNAADAPAITRSIAQAHEFDLQGSAREAAALISASIWPVHAWRGTGFALPV